MDMLQEPKSLVTFPQFLPNAVFLTQDPTRTHVTFGRHVSLGSSGLQRVSDAPVFDALQV